MSRRPRTKTRVSTFRLTLALRWSSFSTSWRLRRASRLQVKAEARLTLLLRATDQQHLHLKELEERLLLLTQQRQEQLDSLAYRTTGVLPPLQTEPLLLSPEESSTQSR